MIYLVFSVDVCGCSWLSFFKPMITIISTLFNAKKKTDPQSLQPQSPRSPKALPQRSSCENNPSNAAEPRTESTSRMQFLKVCLNKFTLGYLTWFPKLLFFRLVIIFMKYVYILWLGIGHVRSPCKTPHILNLGSFPPRATWVGCKITSW